MARVPVQAAALSLSDSARYLGISRMTLYELIADGQLEVADLGPKTKRIRVADLDRLLATASAS